jgi:hypothetical protein
MDVLTGFRAAITLSSDQLLISRAVRMEQPAARQNDKVKSLMKGTPPMRNLLLRLYTDDQGQDIAEYAVMLAVGTRNWHCSSHRHER